MQIPRSPAARRHLGAPMTPMIDVVFLLLIFFVCTANFDPPEHQLSSRLSTAGRAEVSLPLDPQVSDRPPIVIQIPAGQALLRIDGEECRSLPRLAEKLATLTPGRAERTVLLDVDVAARLGRTIDVYDECRLAGFRQVQLAVHQETSR